MRSGAGPIVYVSWRPSRPPVSVSRPVSSAPVVQLFVPCYVDQLYPHVAEATAAILRRAGCEVRFDERQTCCGQPMSNTRLRPATPPPLARRHLDIFRGTTSVSPSASCVSQVRHHFHDLGLRLDGADEQTMAKTFELCEFLVERLRRHRLRRALPPQGRPARQLPRPARAAASAAAASGCVARGSPSRARCSQGRGPASSREPHPPRRVLRVRRHLRRGRGGVCRCAMGRDRIADSRARRGGVHRRHRHVLPHAPRRALRRRDGSPRVAPRGGDLPRGAARR